MAADEVLDVSEEAARRREWRRRRARRVAVPVAFVLVLVASQLAITLQSYHANRAEALRLSDEVVASVSDRIATQVDAYLTPAAQMVEMAAELGAATGSPEALRDLAPLGRRMLETYPQLAMFSIGTVEGAYTGPRKMRGGGMATQVVEREGGRVVFEGWLREVPSDTSGVTVTREATADGYDPRVRPWYRGAVEAGGLFWTDVYLFFDPVVPGVTASWPVANEEGLIGVVGMDIELDALSGFLASLEIGERGTAAIVDAEGRVIAHPRLSGSAGGAAWAQADQMLHVSEVGDAALLRAYNRHRIEGDGAHEAELRGERYRVTSRSLPARLGGDWVVLVAVPEDDFVGFVRRNNRRSLALSLSVLGIASVLAGLLALQGIRADRQAQQVLEQRERLDAQSRALAALGRERRLLDPDDPGGLRAMTELAAETAGVRRCSVWVREGGWLRCVDAFDRATAGHTDGTQLASAAMPEFDEALRTQPVLAAAQSLAEPRLLGLHRQYLAPLGMQAVLVASILAGRDAVGAVMLEDAPAREAWPQDTANFVQALAAVLSVRFRRLGGEVEAADAEASGEAGAAASDATAAVDNARAGAAPTVPPPTAERREGATVLVIDCEARSMHGPDRNGSRAASGNGGASTIELVNRLICCIDAWSDRLGIGPVAVLGERIVVASRPGDDPADAAAAMAQTALELQAQAHEHDPGDAIAVRMGLHTGELTLARIGANRQLPELSGPAVRIASMLAALGMRDCIQTSESTYRLIRDRFLLQDRGRFYTNGFGEVSVFFLNDVLHGRGRRG